MIKLDRENWKIKTDCETVGEFMTEAATFGLNVKVTIDDGDEYFFKGGQKTKVVDNTPIDKVLFDRTDYLFNSCASFRVFTKPKPKTVRKIGWLNIFRIGGKRVINGLYDSKEQADKAVGISDEFHVATVRVEWEEVEI